MPGRVFRTLAPGGALGSFFDFELGPHTIIKLRHTEPADVKELAKRHWESRLDLTCKKGHALDLACGKADVICFACNDNDTIGAHYKCSFGCAFKVCSCCMIKKHVDESLANPVTHSSTQTPPPPDEPRHADKGVQVDAAADTGETVTSKRRKTNKMPPTLRGSVAEALRGSVAESASSSSAVDHHTVPSIRLPEALPLIVIVVRGAVLRSGGRLSDNADGEVDDLKRVLISIREDVLKNEAILSNYRRMLLFDIVCEDANREKKDELTNMIRSLMLGAVDGLRICSGNLGPAQTDSLLETSRWMARACGDPAVPEGFFFLRADCELKRMFDPFAWIRQGLNQRKVVFPFKVWEEGGPADQLFFVPSERLGDLERSLHVLTTYNTSTLQRQSLHYLHMNRCMPGQLAYAADVVCNANSLHEWNPFYRITGRTEKGQAWQRRHKWGDLWF